MVQGIKPLCWINGNTDLWFKELANNWEPKTAREKERLEYYLFAKQRLSEEEIASYLPEHILFNDLAF
jgi:hypothetical protein